MSTIGLPATCVSVGVYGDALTFGSFYRILAEDDAKGHIQVRGDNGRKRWFPVYCFDLSGQPVVRRVRTTIDDALPSDVSVDVILEFSDGQRRCCCFITPGMIADLQQEVLTDGVQLLSFNVPNMIVVSAITRTSITESLDHIESQGELLDCSRPCE